MARDERTIIAELQSLCRSPGYIHAIASFCFRDVMVFYSGEMTAKDLDRPTSHERLIRTEISTLLGFLIQDDISFAFPGSRAVQEFIDRTEFLLKELHQALGEPFHAAFDASIGESPRTNPFTVGAVLREPIFYGGESAYLHQYRDLSIKKYAQDNDWLQANKGFLIHEAVAVFDSVIKFQEKAQPAKLVALRHTPFSEWDITNVFAFTSRQISEASGIEQATVDSVLSAFTLAIEDNNQQFRELNDFNVVNAKPLLRKSEDEFVLFHPYAFAEALYESPFHWMLLDKSYEPSAAENRGRYAEAFCKERLELVFGRGNVFAGVNIYESKGKTVGEIDVLVLFGNRAIILQAKTKRLTLAARKGNEGQIRDDFQKSVQAAYDQGLLCADFLGNPKFRFVDSHSREIGIPAGLKEIHIFCVVSENYPALSFQAKQFLKFESRGSIPPPTVLDVFTLDAITEMLQSPLHFLSYVSRRAKYAENFIATHELTVLSYHLRKNLWLENDTDMMWLADEISNHLDVAMAVRRDGVKGKPTPDGILTRFASTPFERLVKAIEDEPDPGTIDLGFLLLTLSEEAVKDLNKGVSLISKLARQDHRHHDFSLGMSSGSTGLTIHCNDDELEVSVPRLKRHCLRRKYLEKANSWYGVCIHASDYKPTFGLILTNKWKPDARLDELTKHQPGSMGSPPRMLKPSGLRKIGRNDPCPCRSGLKYKKCCLR